MWAPSPGPLGLVARRGIAADAIVAALLQSAAGTLDQRQKNRENNYAAQDDPVCQFATPEIIAHCHNLIGHVDRLVDGASY